MHFKKTVTRLTAGLLLVSSMIAPALAATGTVDTEGSYLRMRTEANTGSAVLKQLAHGTQVEILSTLETGWYQISYEGETGYVSGEYLKVAETGDAADAAVPLAAEAPQAAADPEDKAEENKIYARITEGPLNIRSGPGTDFDRVGTLYAGRIVEVEEILFGWYKIEGGYISADYAVQADPSEAARSGLGQQIADYALQFKGYRYVHGGSSPSGFDCSGFTSYVYKQFGYNISRTCSGQLDNGVPVSMSELQPGDIVIFNKNNPSVRATHVGLYIGDGQFIHASTARVGVIISRLSDAYYTTGFVGGRRIV